MRLVILLLLTYKEETDLRISHNMLDLLFATGGIEGYCDGTDAEGTEIDIKRLHGIL